MCLYCTVHKDGGHVVVEVRPLGLLRLLQPPLPTLNIDSRGQFSLCSPAQCLDSLDDVGIYVFFSRRGRGFHARKC